MRLILALIYTVLTLGALTMVYPFVVMISTSFTSEVDHDEFRPMPRYFTDDTWLFKKYVEAKYNEDLPKFNTHFSNELATFKDIPKPEPAPAQRVQEWQAFRRSLPMSHKMLGGATNLSRITPEMVARYRGWLQRRYETLEAVNRAYGETNAIWEEVLMPIEDWTNRSYQPTFTPKYREFLEFKAAQPERYLWTVPGDGLFQEWLKLKYGAKVEDLNRAWGGIYSNRFQVFLSTRFPAQQSAQEREDWEKFVRTELPAQFVRPDPETEPLYRRFLADKYGSPSALNARYGTRLAGFGELRLPDPPPISGVPFADWMEFIERVVPIDRVSLRTPETRWRETILSGIPAPGLPSPHPPYMGVDWSEMVRDRTAIKWEFLVRNYREVFNYIILHGPALWNTFVLCAGLLCVTLIVNPLCAYALSRFNLPSTYRILLFLLATMAFPAEVSAIPNFLLLKQLHLLNTYWALILPAMANGYSIFLLKGFFDSLPKELYEAAQMDGASEPLMFTRITLPTSKPVLAVISLGTFTTAYGSFLWAFLVCQDPEKWTLMVWLSQMQTWAPMFVIFAALVLAAIPTLLVFVFCQNIIMRGIIIPTEK